MADASLSTLYRSRRGHGFLTFGKIALDLCYNPDEKQGHLTTSNVNSISLIVSLQKYCIYFIYFVRPASVLYTWASHDGYAKSLLECCIGSKGKLYDHHSILQLALE